MSSSILTERGRWAAEQQMTDACTIQHPTGSSTDPATGVVTPTYSTVYTGAAKVNRIGSPAGQDVGEAHLAVLSPTIHVPITVTGVVQGDLVTITASTLDPELVGRTFRVQGPIHETYLTARRLQCTEMTS